MGANQWNAQNVIVKILMTRNSAINAAIILQVLPISENQFNY